MGTVRGRVEEEFECGGRVRELRNSLSVEEE